MGLPTSEQMSTLARIWHVRVYSGKSAMGMLTLEKLLPYRKQSEVDELIANFGFFLGTVQSQQISCRLQVKNCAGLG